MLDYESFKDHWFLTKNFYLRFDLFGNFEKVGLI